MPDSADRIDRDIFGRKMPPLGTLHPDIPPRDVPDSDTETPVKMDALSERLAALYMSMGVLLYTVDPMDAQVIIRDAPKRAVELVTFSKHHPRLRRFLKQITTQSDLAVLAMGHASTVGAILTNHGVDVFASVRASFAEFGQRMRDRQKRNLDRRANQQMERDMARAQAATLGALSNADEQERVKAVFRNFRVPTGPMMEPAPQPQTQTAEE